MIENFGWLIEGRLAGSGCPIHHEELVWLRARGAEAIVSLTERSLRREKLLLHRLDPRDWPITTFSSTPGGCGAMVPGVDS
jgi:hypothetical protein